MSSAHSRQSFAHSFAPLAPSLARDASAALGWAEAYRACAPAGRRAWIDALSADRLQPPEAVALVAPLAEVEDDPDLLQALLALCEPPWPASCEARALLASSPGRLHGCVVVPAWLSFVRVLEFELAPDAAGSPARVAAARSEWLLEAEGAPASGALVRGASVRWSAVPYHEAIDVLAHAVARQPRHVPHLPALRAFAWLFTPEAA